MCNKIELNNNLKTMNTDLFNPILNHVIHVISLITLS